jgi:protein-S-isoprenylcysteine O-methyltransferase Ste14
MEASATPELRREAIRSMLQFQIFVAVVIFLSAWSLRFWQGWLYWFVFSAAVWWITLYFLQHDPHLIQGRMKAGPRNEQRATQKIIQALAGVLAAALIIVPGLDHHFGWSSAPVAVVLIADLLVVVGFAIVFQVFKENSFAASTIKVEDEQRVISSGPYRLVRHPMYSGASMALIATPLALGSLWGVLIALALIAVIVIRLIDEERYLSTNLPGYETYRSKVRYRLIPFVW